MTTTLPAFTQIEDTLFLTLCGRALDNRLPHPILGGRMAEEIVKKLDYDCDRFHLSASPMINIAHRAKKLDEVARNFMSRHPNGPDSSRRRTWAPLDYGWFLVASQDQELSDLDSGESPAKLDATNSAVFDGKWAAIAASCCPCTAASIECAAAVPNRAAIARGRQ
jgi:hypothetical protein